MDPDPTFHSDADPDADPAFLCRSRSGPSGNFSKKNLNLNHFLTQNGFNADLDPDFYLMLIWMELYTLMQIWIQLPKMMRIHADCGS